MCCSILSVVIVVLYSRNIYVYIFFSKKCSDWELLQFIILNILFSFISSTRLKWPLCYLHSLCRALYKVITIWIHSILYLLKGIYCSIIIINIYYLFLNILVKIRLNLIIILNFRRAKCKFYHNDSEMPEK